MNNEITIDGVKYTRVDNKPKTNKRWKAAVGEGYWVVVGDRTAYVRKHKDYISRGDYDANNYFQTKEPALSTIRRQLATVRVLDALREAEGDWVADWEDGGQIKCYPYLSKHKEEIRIGETWFNMYSTIEWCSSKEAWEQVLKTHEDDIYLMIMGERR